MLNYVEFKNVCCTDPTLSHSESWKILKVGEFALDPGYPGYPTFFDHRPAFTADQVDDLLRSCLSCLGFQWIANLNKDNKDPEDASGNLNLNAFQSLESWSLSCFFSTFWKTDWIHHKSIGIAGAPKVLRSSQPKMSRLWSPTSSTPPQVASRGIQWHPAMVMLKDVAKNITRLTMLTRPHKSYKSCHTLLNASVRSNFQNYQCQLLPAITNQWNHGSLQSMLKGPLLTASCQISAARNCSVVPISDSWGSYLLYMCRISKDPMHTPRQSVCCTIHLSQVYPSVTYWDAVNMMDVAWCSINTDTYWHILILQKLENVWFGKDWNPDLIRLEMTGAEPLPLSADGILRARGLVDVITCGSANHLKRSQKISTVREGIDWGTWKFPSTFTKLFHNYHNYHNSRVCSTLSTSDIKFWV